MPLSSGSKLRTTKGHLKNEMADRVVEKISRNANEELIRTHSNAGDNSGGEQEKLMAFCLAGALSFNLASPESADNTPVFAQLMRSTRRSPSPTTALRIQRREPED